MARHHIPGILRQLDTTHFAVVCEPSPAAYAANQPSLDRMLAEYGSRLDAAFIITPHACHHDHARACLDAGLDVLLERPMVMNADEARSLIETRDRMGRLLVVAFNGSLSPQIHTAARLLCSGELGELLSISAVVWQGWGPNTVGTWRQRPEIAGEVFSLTPARTC
jgi:predicted dehydrogenase